ncbi:MAG: alpha/beta hydrolase family protein [Candidatus Promineifilaceae bacterium]
MKPAYVKAQEEQPKQMMEEQAVLETTSGKIYGTLEIPVGAGPFPVVLIIAGSGPTDRDGNSAGLPGKNNSLKLLAAALLSEGIATLRYDKRGIAASAAAAPKEDEMHFETLVADASAWLSQLQDDPRFNLVTIIGHSEGSLIGMIAARDSGADAFISLEGPGCPAQETLLTQLGGQLPPPLLDDAKTVVGSLAAGHEVPALPPALAEIPAMANLFRPTIQPYLISWFRYDPAQIVAELQMPVLIVQGTTDLQVSVDDAQQLVSAKPGAKLVLIHGMNHVLKEAPAERGANIKTYSDPNLPLAYGLVPEIVDFIRSVPGH